jgi:hypothetical protein
VRIMITVMLLLCASTNTSLASEFRVAYIEGNRFSSFIMTYQAVKKRLHELGVADKLEFPMPDACYSPNNDLTKEEREAELARMAHDLLVRKDIDMIFAAGTDATAALLNHSGCIDNENKRVREDNPACQLPIPIIASSVSDAVKSGFVLNIHDSGIDNFSVGITPDGYIRMVRVFHDEVQFKKLGLLYIDSESGRQFSNVEDAQVVAKERGFSLVHQILTEPVTQAQCDTALKKMVSQGIDAFYMSVFTCFEWGKPHNDVVHNIAYLLDNKIRIFARQGSRDVKAGALMGFSSLDFSARARFVVDMMIKVMQGSKPRNLSMIDQSLPTIALNLYTAQKIGFDPSFDILGASDEIYQEITAPDNTQAMILSPCDTLNAE